MINGRRLNQLSGKFLLGLLLLWSLTADLQAQISGRVADRQDNGLPGATLLLLPDSLYAASDENGEFRFSKNTEGWYRVQASFIGYHSITTAPFFWPAQAIPPIQLDQSTALLEAILIEEEHDHFEDELSTSHLNHEWMRQADRSSFAVALEREPGIAVIRTGVGIAKPVIRGLSSQRIIVQDQGIKQEGQQWGADHGLEIDPFAVERVEIVKGPGSLLYGSDGLGGVIRILPPSIPEEGVLSLTLETVYRSVNQHGGGTVHSGYRKKNFFVQGRYSAQRFGDYVVPADRFVFQGFELPIVDGQLKNTAGRENAFQVQAGRIAPRSMTRFSLSFYQLEAGLFSGAVGIPRSYALEPDGNRRDIDFPSQLVEHWKLALNQHLEFGEDLLSIDLGVQRNLRREFSFPEFHSLPALPPGSPNPTTALELDLYTLSLNAHYDQQLGRGWMGIYGLDWQSQFNRSGGFETLLPDYRLYRAGLYAVAIRKLQRNNRLTLGFRLDGGENHSDFQQRYIYTSSGDITDSLRSEALLQRFGNYSLAIGYNREFEESGLLFRIHGGKSFRLPHPAETVSNGVHHGTFRHEVGNPAMSSEHGYQLDAGLEWEAEKVFAVVSGYFNFFDNYIYLAPSARLSPLPEAGQLFEYRQDDVFYTGFEIQSIYKPMEWLSADIAAEYVYNYNLETTLALPFTPPASIRAGFQLQRPGRGVFGRSYASFSARYRFAQNRTDRNERSTPEYWLIDAAIGTKIQMGRQEVDVQLQAFNLLNAFYLDHLSRYRLIGIPEPGRNIVLQLRVPLNFVVG